MEIEAVKVISKITINIDIDDLIKDLNQKPLLEKWVYIKKILDDLFLKNIEELKPGESKLIINFLETQLKFFKP